MLIEHIIEFKLTMPGSEMETGRVEILRPAGQASRKTGQILLSGY